MSERRREKSERSDVKTSNFNVDSFDISKKFFEKMSQEENRKRKSPERQLTSEIVNQCSDEPDLKLMRLTGPTQPTESAVGSDPNLNDNVPADNSVQKALSDVDQNAQGPPADSEQPETDTASPVLTNGEDETAEAPERQESTETVDHNASELCPSGNESDKPCDSTQDQSVQLQTECVHSVSETSGYQTNEDAKGADEDVQIDIESSTSAVKDDACKEVPNTQEHSESHSISIKFKDDAVADLYKLKFLNFISTFRELQVTACDKLGIDVCHSDRQSGQKRPPNDEISQFSSGSEISPSQSSKRRKKKSKSKRELFVVDATPSAETKSLELQYTSKFSVNADVSTKETVAAAAPPQQTCFNCDDAHAVRDCPHPKNFSRINAARQKFVRQQPRSKRYHLEDEQKYSHLAPGKLSSDLRKALGLRKDDVPQHIYIMRRLGYPPGWLEEAKIVHSNLGLFDLDGNHVKECQAKKRGIDIQKVVDYPGFNVPLEEGIRDEFRAYNVPPYSDNYSKEAMIKFFNAQQAQVEDDLEVCDMDMSQPIENSDLVLETTQTEEDSVSLFELEVQKEQLLKKLEDVEQPDDDYLTVKTSDFGTPILKSSSPYMKLPDPDNFSKDVSPVINFENLPNSTGKYEQMTDVIHKVRSTLKKLQNCTM